MGILDREPFASFLGRGRAGITVPTLDGAFRPNDLLEQATLVGDYPGADTIVAGPDGLLLSAGNRVLALKPTDTGVRAQFDAPISAFAAQGSTLAVGLASGQVQICPGSGAPMILNEVSGRRLVCPTALLFHRDRLIVADGSDRNGPEDWSRDLLERNAGGRVLSIDPATGRGEVLASQLAFPNGLVLAADETLIVSQSWRHYLSRVDRPDEATAMLRGLPGYPSRIAPAADGGFWLALFGMRTQLLEFVLREHAYRKRMLATVPPEYWVAPALKSRENFLDPLQQGGVKQLGIKKPWAPPRSYGLVVKLDAGLNPEFSLHSRVGGSRHGVTSVCEFEGLLYVVSKGAGQVVSVDLPTVRRNIVQ